MPDVQRHLDLGSKLVIVVTFVLFVAAIFFQGLSHDLLLEAGVFLVSMKLIMMAYKSSVVARQLAARLDGLQATLTRLEGALESRRPSEIAVGQPNKALQPAGTPHRPEDAKGG